MARPSAYKEEFEEQAYKLALLGATDKQIADFFGVTEQTLNNWKTSKEGFFESLKRGKLEADAKVGEALYQRALGYTHPEDKIFQYEGAPVVVPTTKHYPPDVTAMIFWLKNRLPDQWREKQEIKQDIDAKISVEWEEPPTRDSEH